jgi:hypothetical protein
MADQNIEVLSSADEKVWRVVETIRNAEPLITIFEGRLARARAKEFADARRDIPLPNVKHADTCRRDAGGFCSCGEETMFVLRWLNYELDGRGEGVGLVADDRDSVSGDSLVQPEITLALVRAIRQVFQNRRVAADARAS